MIIVLKMKITKSETTTAEVDNTITKAFWDKKEQSGALYFWTIKLHQFQWL